MPPYVARIYLARRPPGYQALSGPDVTQITAPRAMKRDAAGPMEQTLGWARMWYAAKRDEELDAQLRHGAWYPVLSAGDTRAVLDVSGRRVVVPQDLLEVRAKRPDRFTVVYRTYDDPNPARGTRADLGRRYAVCPMCASRVLLRGHVIPSVTTCTKCGHQGIVAWWETG
jgi:hypothetical protein